MTKTIISETKKYLPKMLPGNEHPKAIEKYTDTCAKKGVSLRLATVRDSGFILSLRLDPQRNAHISPTSASLADQEQWMLDYEKRFHGGMEAYFIITNKGEDVGTVRIYDYTSENSFCWGSWLIKPGTNEFVAFVTPILVYDLGFYNLKFEKSHFEIRQENSSVWRFEEMMGAELINHDSLNRSYKYHKAAYAHARTRLAKLIGLSI